MLLYLFFLYIYYKRINFLHYFVQANSMIRLRGGRDHIWMPLHVVNFSFKKFFIFFNFLICHCKRKIKF